MTGHEGVWQRRLPGKDLVATDCELDTGGGATVSAALQEVADLADAVADEQHQIAEKARAMQHLRDRGWSWAKILDSEDGPVLVDLLRRNSRRVLHATSRVTRSLAAGLAGEGASRREIGRRLGVSHQRISAMLNHGHPSEPGDG
jgi:hypothetical protein